MASQSNRRHVFISHHFADDNSVTNLISLLSKKGYDFRNSAPRLKEANKKRLEAGKVPKKSLERLLRMKISWAGTVVVLIGKDTHSRPWVDFEIQRAKEQGKRIIGVFERGGTEADLPKGLLDYSSGIVNWNTESIISAINGENAFQNPDGSPRVLPSNGVSVNC